MTEPSQTPSLADLLPTLRVIVARVAGPRDIDDIVQECCVRLLEKEHQFRGGPGGFRAWASTVTRNLSRTFLLKRANKVEELMEHADLVANADPTIDDERVGWILDQVSRLPKDDRTLLRMRYFDGMTVEEVGRQLDLSQAGASKRLERVVSTLKSRANAQGWLGSLLPTPWAAGLAGTSMMKLSLFGVSTVAAAVFSGSFFLPDAETPVQGSTATLKHTAFLPSLNSPLDPAQNQLWCGALQLAYDALVDSVGSDFDAEDLDAFSAQVHSDPFKPEFVDTSSYVAVAGEDVDSLIEVAQAQLVQKFGRGRDPVLDLFRGSGAPLVYAFLAKSMPFPRVFEDLAETPFEFGTAKTDVETWGMAKFVMGESYHMELAESVDVIHYGGPDDFVLEFKPAGNERIVLARVKPGKTLAATWSAVQAQRVAAKLTPAAFDGRPVLLDAGDRLIIPKLDFDLSHIFPGLSTGANGRQIATTLQTLRVRLDQNGAELKSRVSWLSDVPLHRQDFIFDGPFLAAFVEGDATVPFAALWIANAELLVPRRDAQGNVAPAVPPADD